MATSLLLRKNVSNLSGPELAALRDAYAKMMKITDNRGYNYWSGIHGVPQWFCWHHGRIGNGSNAQPVDLFLPWHRAYLILLEHTMRDQNAGAAIPWWDWTSLESHTIGVPKAFADKSAGGKPNPLRQAHIKVPPQFNRTTRRFPGSPSDLPAPGEVQALLALSSFSDFTSQVQDIHDRIHGWTGGMGVVGGKQVGGDMGTISTAAFDPIFYSHHCMIDRIWYLWQLQHGQNNIPSTYLGMTLTPFPLKVQDVLNIHSLGYEYASASAEVTVHA
ncbi:MAG TPA: tyrosinase family protein [Thermoanaerobaculia bacterium]|nr:tyrosinase family protein [Thermoanaerobaculia bacterium]